MCNYCNVLNKPPPYSHPHPHTAHRTPPPAPSPPGILSRRRSPSGLGVRSVSGDRFRRRPAPPVNTPPMNGSRAGMPASDSAATLPDNIAPHRAGDVATAPQSPPAPPFYADKECKWRGSAVLRRRLVCRPGDAGNLSPVKGPCAGPLRRKVTRLPAGPIRHSPAEKRDGFGRRAARVGRSLGLNGMSASHLFW